MNGLPKYTRTCELVELRGWRVELTVRARHLETLRIREPVRRQVLASERLTSGVTLESAAELIMMRLGLA